MTFSAPFAFFLTWWGAFLIAFLDATIIFFLPFGVDAIVIYLSARHSAFWGYPVLATLGSTAGAAVTFWIGKKAGENGLERLVPPNRLRPLQRRVHESGAIALAMPALFPPPFPLTPFVLTCGALEVDPVRFFSTFAGIRLLRFGIEAALAQIYGRGIVRLLESGPFQTIVIGFIVVAAIGTAVSVVTLWRRTHQAGLRPA